MFNNRSYLYRDAKETFRFPGNMPLPSMDLDHPAVRRPRLPLSGKRSEPAERVRPSYDHLLESTTTISRAHATRNAIAALRSLLRPVFSCAWLYVMLVDIQYFSGVKKAQTLNTLRPPISIETAATDTHVANFGAQMSRKNDASSSSNQPRCRRPKCAPSFPEKSKGA